MYENYKELPPLIDEALIERARKFGSAELCDGMKGMGVERDGCMDADIMPVNENLKMVGTASTVDTTDGDNFPIHVAIYQSKPGYVLCIDGKAYKERTYLGDLMGGAAKAIGILGLVVDGYVRDKIGLREMELPVYTRGFMQRTPSKKGPGKINGTIRCGGVIINPGDLVVGDYDGVTVVPRGKIEAVLDAAEAKTAYEEKRREEIAEYANCRKEGKPLPNLAPKWVLDMLDKK
jgi:regulator of RNase E activity RraA